MTFLDDERTDAVALHNKARSYLRSARYLNAASPGVSCSHAGVTFLFCHAIELFLLSYLRAHGGEGAELDNLNRRVAATTSRAVGAGLKLHPDVVATLSQIAETLTSIEVRYIVTGVKQIPNIGPLSNAAQKLDAAVSKALEDLGLRLPEEISPRS